MRKWTGNRQRGRKKKGGETPAVANTASDAAAPPPLQPVLMRDYVLPVANSAPPTSPVVPDANLPTSDAAGATNEGPGIEEDMPSPGSGAESAVQNSFKKRKRRRGRGGRGRPQKATPAAAATSRNAAPVSDLPGIPEVPYSGTEAGSAVETQPPSIPLVAPTVVPHTRPSKGTVVLAIGLPGSGKSTWFKRRGVTPLSSDLLRALLFDDVMQQKFGDLVFSILRSMLRSRLIARMPMNYVDATNLSPHERKSWIKMARDFGYEVQAVYFDVPLDICMERNRKRERVVPETDMQRLGAKLRPPTFEEGFSKITVVRVKKSESPSGEAPHQQPA
jgi:predicted kinase